KLYKQLTRQVSALQEDWRKQLHKEEIDGATYIQGKHFLESLESAIKMLPQPGTARLLDGTYSARGRNVQELVNNMTSNGLSFAAATPGDEAAYYALQNVLVAYTRGAQPESAFQVRSNLPPPQADGNGPR